MADKRYLVQWDDSRKGWGVWDLQTSTWSGLPAFGQEFIARSIAEDLNRRAGLTGLTGFTDTPDSDTSSDRPPHPTRKPHHP